MLIKGRFVKRPIAVEMVQINNFADVVEARHFCPTCIWHFIATPPVFSVQSNEGQVRGKAGDWIVRGAKGEFYIIADSIKAETYEEVLG